MARANLEAKLTADTGPFIRSMAAAQASAAKFSVEAANRVGLVGGALNKVAAASRGFQAQIAAAFTVGTFSKIAKELDDIGDAAANLEVAPGFLDALGQAARLTGTDAQTATAAMERLLQTIGEARRGDAAALEKFADLGIDINRLQNNEQAVFAIAKALGQYETNAERAAAATELMGKGAKKMTELFAEGEEGLRGYIKRTEEAGLVSSELAVKVGGQLTDQFGTLIKQLKVFGGEALAGFAVAGTAAQNFLDSFRESFNENLSLQAIWEKRNQTGLGFNLLKQQGVAAMDAIKKAAEDAGDAVDELAAPDGSPASPLPGRGFVQPSGRFGLPFLFGAPFSQEAVAEFLERARFTSESQTFPGIPLSGAGQGTLETWEAQRRWENQFNEAENRRSEREGRPSEAGGIRLDTDTQLMLQEMRRNTKALEQIEANTAPLRE